MIKPIDTRLLIILLTCFLTLPVLGNNITFSSSAINKTTHQLTVNITLPRGDFIYKDYLDFSVDHPDVTLSDWHASMNSVPYYDPTFRETKQIFNKNFKVTLTAKR